MAVRLAAKNADTLQKLREILEEARWEGRLTHQELDELEKTLRITTDCELIHTFHKKP